VTTAFLSVGFFGSDLSAQPIADSAADWSTEGVQGEKNWFYGYYNKTTDEDPGYETDDFIEFTNEFGAGGGEVSVDGNHWAGGHWDLTRTPPQPWTEIRQATSHPNGNNNGDVHWTVRRWVNLGDDELELDPIDEQVSITWTLSKANANGGNGVTGLILHNGVEIDRATIAGTDAVGVERVVCIEIAPGDMIEFAHTPEGINGTDNDGSDGTNTAMIIDFEGPDLDLDGIDDCTDNCLGVSNSDQEDADGDGVGDLCDNCPDDSNEDQTDTDEDGVGDACQDSDDDTHVDAEDNCFLIANEDQADGDGDGVGDLCDNCPADSNSGQEDGDGDGVGDACQDRDGDGALDTEDNCPAIANSGQEDLDADGTGDVCDNCPNDANADQADDDDDGVGNVCDNPLAHSITDWTTTGTQGENNWYSGYYNLTLDENEGDGVYQADDFTEFTNACGIDGDPCEGGGPIDRAGNHWNGGSWDLNQTRGPWTTLGRENTHPNGTNSVDNTDQVTREEHWTMRRWVSTVDGCIAVVWHLRKTNGRGTGVAGILFHNDDEIDRANIAGNDQAGFVRIVVRQVSVGDTIDLAHTPVGPDGNRTDGSDGSANYLKIFEDPDLDRDGVPDCGDNCIGLSNADQADGDGDGIGDLCDNCVEDSNADQGDCNGDGIGDVCDPADGDGDGVHDCLDNCPSDDNADQADADDDGVGDVCDNCADVANASQSDRDRDGSGDECDAGSIADSYEDWSSEGEQGVNNWIYGWFDAALDDDGLYVADDFQEFFNEFGPDGGAVLQDGNHWTGTIWDFNAAAAGPWTLMGQEITHPNDNRNGGEHWTIRRWESDRDGEVLIRWNVRKQNPNPSGVTGMIFVNDDMVDLHTISGRDSVGMVRELVVTVASGDSIDMALSPLGLCNDPNDGSDGTFNWMQIEEVPESFAGNSGLVLTESTRDWSTTGTQGENGWSYGYYDQGNDVLEDDGVYSAEDDFIEFLNDGTGVVSADPEPEAWQDSLNHWNGTMWDLLNNAAPVSHGPWTAINCTAAHPAANGQTDTAVHWAIRRWESNHEGDIAINGFAFNQSTGGDGTVVRVLHNGTEIYSGVTNGSRLRFSVTATVAEGDFLDFAIDADGAGNFDPDNAVDTLPLIADGADSTDFNVAIEAIEPVEIDPKGGFRRGDADDNGVVQLTDAIRILAFLFQGGPAPTCSDAADADDNSTVQLTDAIRILAFLFQGGPEPLDPGSTRGCGPDPTDDDNLGCESYESCD